MIFDILSENIAATWQGVQMRPKKNELGSMKTNGDVEIWLDETLSDKDFTDQARLLDACWSDVYGRKDLTPSQRTGHPLVLQYLYVRCGIMNSLSLVRDDPRGSTAARLDGIKEDKFKVLEIISHKRFAEYLNLFDIGEEHPLSPTNLFRREIAKNTAESKVSQASRDPAQFVPHYTSAWKNAILLALLAKGVGADYLTVARYITDNFPFVERPGFREDRKRDSIAYLVALVPDESGTFTPRDAEISAQFQRDRSRIKTDLEKYFRALADSPFQR